MTSTEDTEKQRLTSVRSVSSVVKIFGYQLNAGQVKDIYENAFTRRVAFRPPWRPEGHPTVWVICYSEIA